MPKGREKGLAVVSSAQISPRIPLPVDGIQINFCKNPACGNYLTPASHLYQPRGKNARNLHRDDYIVSGGDADGAQVIQCKKCGECPPIKSNLGIKEEYERISAYLDPVKPLVCCPNGDCENHGVELEFHPERYWSFGKTKAGSKRFRCKACLTTFTTGQKPTNGQRHTNINASIFMALVNKQPLKRIAFTNHISMKTFYDRLNFIYEQCRTFAGSRERNLPNMKRKYMNISVDRQFYSVNWATKEDRRVVMVYGVGSADRKSGFVFGVHLNYDPSLTPEKVELDAIASGDYSVKRAMRKYARFWLERDYLETTRKTPPVTKVSTKDPVWLKSAAKYHEAVQRDDIEAVDEQYSFSRLPKYGMLVHAEYTLYAHFFFLKDQLAGIENVRFYLDQDSGMRAACLGAFAERVLDKSCNAFYVTIKTEYSQEEKLSLVSRGRRERMDFLYANPEYTEALDIFIRREIIKGRLGDMVEIGRWRDLWLEYPFPDMSEPAKIVCYLTNIRQGGYDTDLDNLALMYERATLHPIDRFFMQARSASTILDRSHRTSNRAGRVWQRDSAYNPETIAKILEIYRVYYNYVALTPGKMGKRPKGQPKRKRGELKKLMKTPAMRIGLAKGPVSIDAILGMPVG